MNCYIHAENQAVGACTSCGRPICQECALEVQGKLVCRTCLAEGRVNTARPTDKDPNTAFLLELIGGFLGFLGVGHIYIGQTNDGVLRLILWILYNVIAYITITLLISVFIGILCIPIQLVIQICVPLWSANNLKNQMLKNASGTGV